MLNSAGGNGLGVPAPSAHHCVLTPKSQAVVLHLAPGILHGFF